ncbi:MAG TPA: MFS transporter [Solirubrobacteraceae bacterium]|nr:MFS transporter [Solirubrobacteraceae bacterium]
MSTSEPTRKSSSTSALALATIAFTVCFYAWSLLGPLGPKLQKQLGLSDFELLVTVAVPVLLGSLMRVPLGILTDREGGRRVFTALMAFTPIPLIGLALFNHSWAAVLGFGFLLGFAGASFAVGVPFVNGWYPPERQGFALGVYGMGMGGTVLGALTAPKIADSTSLSVPFWIAAGLVAVMAAVFWTLARDAPRRAPAATGSMLAPLAVFRGPDARRAWALTLFYFMAFGGFVAMFLFLPKMLTGVHHLSKPDAGYRAAGFAALAVIGRPLGGWLSDRIGAARVLQVSFAGTLVLALVLAGTYRHMVPLTIACLAMALCLGLGTGAVFKLVAQWYPGKVGVVGGVVGAAGGLGGFFPPVVMGIVKSSTGGYGLGFILMGVVAAMAFLVVVASGRGGGGAHAATAERQEQLVAS